MNLPSGINNIIFNYCHHPLPFLSDIEPQKLKIDKLKYNYFSGPCECGKPFLFGKIHNLQRESLRHKALGCGKILAWECKNCSSVADAILQGGNWDLYKNMCTDCIRVRKTNNMDLSDLFFSQYNNGQIRCETGKYLYELFR